MEDFLTKECSLEDTEKIKYISEKTFIDLCFYNFYLLLKF